MPLEEQVVTSKWNITEIPAPTGGLNTADEEYRIADNEAVQMSNCVVRQGQVRPDSGYTELGDDPFSASYPTFYGNPRKPIQYVDNTGTQIILMVTDTTVYTLGAGDEWRVVTRGDDDTLAVGLTGTETSITLVSDAGFAVGDVIGILDDSSDLIMRKIDALPGANVVDLDVALPAGFTAAIGNAVHAGPNLTGNNTKNVVHVHVPSAQSVIFTNGVDRVQIFDGSTCQELTEIFTDISVTTCETVGLFANSVILGNITEGGAQKPHKVYWSDTGDPNEWATGNSGNDELFDTRDPIVGMKLLGDVNIIYRSRSIIRQEFVGTELQYFNFRTMIFGEEFGAQGVGAVGHNAIFPFESEHIFMSRDGIYSYKGGFSVENIGRKIFKGQFDSNGAVDKEVLYRGFLQYVPEYDDLYCFYPSTLATEYCDKALILNVASRVWTTRNWTHEMTGSSVRLVSESITYNDLIGQMIEQEWTALSRTVDGQVPTVLLTSVDTDNKVFEYDYISNTDNGTDIVWVAITKHFRQLDREIRFDRFDFLLAGGTVIVNFKFDGALKGGVAFTPGGALVRQRQYFQQVASSFQLIFRNTSASGAVVGDWSIRHRDSARWTT
jgi:hypothetical protein